MSVRGSGSDGVELWSIRIQFCGGASQASSFENQTKRITYKLKGYTLSPGISIQCARAVQLATGRGATGGLVRAGSCFIGPNATRKVDVYHKGGYSLLCAPSHPGFRVGGVCHAEQETRPPPQSETLLA